LPSEKAYIQTFSRARLRIKKTTMEILGLFASNYFAQEVPEMMIKSRVGAAFAVTALVLALSPEARKMARKLAIRATEAVLELSEKTKDATESMKKQMQSVVEEARSQQPSP
jgi:hypothetical protein